MDRIPRQIEFISILKGNLYRVVTLATHSETGGGYGCVSGLYGDFSGIC